MADSPTKRGVLPFDLAMTFAGGVSEYRLHRLVEDGVLVRKEDGLDAPQFFRALEQQEETRKRVAEARPWLQRGTPHVFRGEDDSTRLFLAFIPGFVDIWQADLSVERLPGVDYDAAIRDAIIAGSNDYEGASAIEAAIWLRFGDPAGARLTDLKQLAAAIAASWPKILLWQDSPDWRKDYERKPSVAGFFPTARAALETALGMRRWTIHLGPSRLIDHATSDQIPAGLRFWADRVPDFNPRCDGVANGLRGANIDLFDKAMAQLRRTAGQFFDFYADNCGRATC